MAYVAPNLSAVKNICEYLWNTFDDEQKESRSILSDYIDIQPIPGKAGCDTIIDIDLIKNKYLELADYFKPLVQMLEEHGYVYGRDLFCYTYDWRQVISHKQIQQPLDNLIKICHKISSKKVILIGHSLGGQVIDTYLRTHKDFNDHVCKFVALATPFNGSSAKILASQTEGYNLGMPIKYIVSKGIQCSCGSVPWMAPYVSDSLPTFSQIFLKLEKENISTQQQSEDIKRYNQIQIQSQNRQYTPLETVKQQQQIDEVQTQTQQQNKYNQIQLNKSVYDQFLAPDVCFVIAQNIMKNKSVDQDKIIQTMEKLQKCCEPGAIVITYDKDEVSQSQSDNMSERIGEKINRIIRTKYEPQEIFEPDFSKNEPQQLDFRKEGFVWESYGFFSNFSQEINQQYQFINNRYIKQDGDKYVLDQDKKIQKDENGNIRYSVNKDKLEQYFIAKQYQDEMKSTAVPRKLTKHKLICTTEFDDSDLEQPWQSIQMHNLIQAGSIVELNQKMYPKGTLEHEIFHASKVPYEIYNEVKHMPINFDNKSEFRFYSVIGYGEDTGLHAVFQKPVKDYSEITKQHPEYVYVTGDSTVLTTCALADGYPDFVIGEKICVQNMTHFGILQDQRMYKFLIEEVLGMKYQK